jgi:hypothetical protein
MAIDFDAIRKKLNQISGGNSKKDIMWRPAEGTTTTVRLLSFQNNDGQPFKELWFYYNIGPGSGYLAPHQFGKPDPFQELINKLRDDGKKGDKQAYELAKKLYPKMRIYAPVLVRDEEDKGVRLWSFGKGVYETLLGYLIDEDYGDITDPLNGYDIKVTVSKSPGKQYTDTTITPRPKTSPLSQSQEQAKKYLNSIPDLDSMFELKSYDQLKKVLDDWLNGADAENDESEGTTREAIEPSDLEGNQAKQMKSVKSKPKKESDELSDKMQELDDAFSDFEA